MKKRLLGAAVLIALAVIFVPMLLPSHSGSNDQSVSVTIPPEPNGDMQTRILQVGPNGASAGSSTAATITDPDHVATLNLERGHARASTAPPPAAVTNTQVMPPSASSPAASTVARASAPATARTAPAVVLAAVAPSVAASAAATKVAANAAPIAGGPGAAARAAYSVNLGIYTDHASAEKLVAQAKQHGYTALATPETFRGKSVLRVLVGPFSSRAQAEAARLRLKGFEGVSSMTIEGSAIAQKGDAPVSAIAAAGQPGGWAVQLAAFAVETQANALRDRLRGQGFDGYVDSIDTARGRLWRVRAGPFASRALAVSTRGEIAQKLQITGDIVTQN